MNTSIQNNKTEKDSNKEFWDSLHSEIIKSYKDFSREDIFSYVEKSFMFSLFFRGTSHESLIFLGYTASSGFGLFNTL